MTYFIKLKDGVPIEHPHIEANIRDLFPQLEGVLVFTPEIMEPLGFGIYDFTSKPSISDRYKKAVEVTPVKSPSTGVWMQTWAIVPMTDEEKSEVDAQQVLKVKSQRSFMLNMSDWTQNPDNNLSPEKKEEYRIFRQNLRDIPQQPGFPWEVQWPEKPEGFLPNMRDYPYGLD